MADQAKPNGKAPETNGAADEPVPGESLPALFANRFYVLAGPGMTRIAFGEHVDGGEVHYRHAMILPTTDARELAEVLADVLRRVESMVVEPQPALRSTH